MAKTAILAIRIISDATKAAKGFRQAETSTQKFERRLGTANKAALAVAGGLGLLAAKARSEASDLQQSAGAVEAVYGRQAKAIKKASATAAKSLGLAKSDYQNMASILGSQLNNLGVAQQQLVPKTKDLIKLGGDLAATFGGPTSDAVDALSALLRGERDPIERYGVSIKQADINARLAAKGQDKLKGAALRNAQTQATLELLYKQTAKAQGQRAREANTDAQREEVARAKIKNAFAAYGKIVLPITAKVSEGIANVAGWTEKHQRETKILIGIIGGLAGAVLALNAAYKVYKVTQQAIYVATVIYKNAQLALNLAMAANPVGLIVVALVALAAGLVVAYKKSDTFRKIVNAMGAAGKAAVGWIVTQVRSLVSHLSGLGPAATVAKKIAVTAFKAYTAPIRGVVALVQKLVGWIKKIKFPKPPKWVGKVAGWAGLGGPGPHDGGSGHAPGLGGAGGPGTTGGYVLPAGGGRGGMNYIQVTVNGALDPDAVARQIEKILRRRSVRIGAT